MTNNIVPSSDLIDFFNLKERGLPCVLRELNLRPLGGNLTWPVAWKALGLAAKQNPEHHCELKKPLMTAAEVGVFRGVSARTIYRWQEGIGLPTDRGPMPSAIDLSAGRTRDCRHVRWVAAGSFKLRTARRPMLPGRPTIYRLTPNFFNRQIVFFGRSMKKATQLVDRRDGSPSRRYRLKLFRRSSDFWTSPVGGPQTRARYPEPGSIPQRAFRR